MLQFWKETRFLNLRNNLNLYYDATPLFVACSNNFFISGNSTVYYRNTEESAIADSCLTSSKSSVSICVHRGTGILPVTSSAVTKLSYNTLRINWFATSTQPTYYSNEQWTINNEQL